MLAAAIVGSHKRTLSYSRPGPLGLGWSVGVVDKHLLVRREYPNQFLGNGWSFGKGGYAMGTGWPVGSFGRHTFAIALWLPLAAISAATLVLYLADRRYRPPGACRKCRYDLSGLADPAAPCPECGADA